MACVAVVLAAYALSAVLLASSTEGSDFHRRTARAIVGGHLDIRPVPADLRSMPDPYDPAVNLDTRINDDVQDLAYRNGRLYSAHGLTVPVLLSPITLLLGTAPPNWLITLVAGWTGFLCGIAILQRLRRSFPPQLPRWVPGSIVIAFGMCGPTWVLMSKGNGYEAAIAVAFAFTMAGCALLLRACDQLPRLRRRSAVAGSLCLGAAVGARPTAVVVGLALAVAAADILRQRRLMPMGLGSRSRVPGDLAALLVPYGSILVALAAANVGRFGSLIEFGFGYQLSVWNMTTYPIGRIGYLGPNLSDYLLAPPLLSGRFPWVRLRGMIGGGSPDVHTAEPIVGLVFLAPVVLVGLTALVRERSSMRRNAPLVHATTTTAALIGVMTLVAVSFPFNTSTLRYAVDGAPLLVLAACIAWAWSRAGSTDPKRSRRLDVVWIACVAFGVVVTASVQVPF